MLHLHSSASMAGTSLPVYSPLRVGVQTQKSRDKQSLSKALKCLWFGSSVYINVCMEVSGSPTSQSSDYLTPNVSLGSQLWEQQRSQLDCAPSPSPPPSFPFPISTRILQSPHIPLTRDTFNWHRKQLSLGLCLTTWAQLRAAKQDTKLSLAQMKCTWKRKAQCDLEMTDLSLLQQLIFKAVPLV